MAAAVRFGPVLLGADPRITVTRSATGRQLAVPETERSMGIAALLKSMDLLQLAGTLARLVLSVALALQA